MNIKNLKVGDKVSIREDLIHLQEYGNAVYYKAKGSGKRTISWFYNDNKKDTFVTEENDCYYTVEMIDWEKTIKLRREKMNINDLKAGDVVYIKDDLEFWQVYGSLIYYPKMRTGLVRVKYVSTDYFRIHQDGIGYLYTVEMIDWEKTRKIREIDFKKIIQYGECRNEITKGVTYGGKEIVVKNNREENDPEKAVMLLMLKARGVTYSAIKEEAKKVEYKWKPEGDEQYYFINGFLTVRYEEWSESIFDKKRFRDRNCFRTREEAEKKLEKIKEVLKGGVKND